MPAIDWRVGIPTSTDPRGADFGTLVKQQEWMVALERRASDALGVLIADTRVNYHTIMPPIRGESMPRGDTGVTIYFNSVLGARSNFEGGPSALAAGVDRLHAALGYHLDDATGETGRRPYGLDSRIEAVDAVVLSSMCFYQSYARKLAEATNGNGWRRIRPS